MKKVISLLLICFLSIINSQTFAADTCGIAADISKKAFEVFKQDKKKGVSLFLKAEKLCPDNPDFTYNTGVAWYLYGRNDKALPALTRAVKKKPSLAEWQNALACAFIKSGKYKTAAAHAKKAVKLDSKKPGYRETLARALLLCSDYENAWQTICAALKKWKKNKKISEAYSEVLESYLSNALTKVKSPETRGHGFSLLEKACNDPKGAKAYAISLAATGKITQALQEAAKAEKKFSGHSLVAGLFNEIMAGRIRSIYKAFTSGNQAGALSDAKILAESYPSSKNAKKAYDKLFNAYISDTGEIDIPEPVLASTHSQKNNKKSDKLLAGMWGGDTNETIKLTVDVDTNIPLSKDSKPKAVAVVIGNSRYSGSIPDVDYAISDAKVMRQYLIKSLGYSKSNIIFEKNVTSGAFRNIFGSPGNPRGKLHNYARKGGEVFIYYSGHGAPGPDGKAAYLVPVDASADYIANNGYPVDFFYKMIEKLDTSKTTIVLDACFSGDSGGGQLFKKISPALVKNIRPVREIKNCVIFSAADKDQVSVWHPEKRHGLFTYFFLKGLSGAADKSGNHQITAGEMKTYLSDEVSYWARRIANREQTPLVRGDESSIISVLR